MANTPLTPEQEQERLELIQRQNAAAKELASTYEKISKTVGGLSNEDKEILDIAKKMSKLSSDIEKSISKRLDKTSSIKDLTKNLNTLEQNILKNADIANKLEKTKIDAINESLSARLKEIQIQEKIKQEYELQQEILDRIEDLKKSQGPIDRAALANAREELKSSKAALDIFEKELKKTTELKDRQRNLAIQLDENIKAHQETIKAQQEEIELTKQTIEAKKKKGILDVLEEKFDVKKIKDMTTIAGMFKIMLESALKFNEISVQTSKSLGYSASEADRVTQNLVEVAQHSKNTNVTLENAGAAMNELNEATGYVAEYSADALETHIMLTKQFGMQTESAARVYELSLLTGKSSSQVNKEMVGAFAAASNQLKAGIPFRATMEAAAKVSGRLAANLQNNPVALVKAVAQAKAFGTTLEQVAKQGDTLLDFEQSLESELKAELLTGKQLNLERARAAALTGDQVALAEELQKNVGSLEDFQKMNVLQQKSLAEAMGLTADELADQLRKQKIAQEQGKSLAQVEEEQLAEAQERQKIQDKFNQAILKLQDLIGNLVAGPFAMLLDALSTALGLITWIFKPIQLIVDLAGYIGEKFASWSEALGPFGILLKGIAGIAIVLAAYGAYAALAWIPVVGPILGAAAAVAVLAKGFSALADAKKAGDMYSPADGETQVSTKEGGLFELSKNDDLLAGPGLADKVKSDKEGSILPQIDLTPMITAINAVKAAVDRLYNKDTSINMDSRAVGSTLSQQTTRLA